MEEFINKVICGDCEDYLPLLPDNSVEAIITDPPAGFLSEEEEWGVEDDKAWGPVDAFNIQLLPRYSYYDKDAFINKMTRILTECYRILKPGGHLIVWATPKTSHWTATAIENAGFEIRDIIHHIFIASSPRYLNLATLDSARYGEDFIKEWKGWTTGLKRSCEHWILGRKKLQGNTIDNLKKWQVGALNLYEGRIPSDTGEDRYPSNTIVSDNALDLDENQSQYFNLNQWSKHHGLLFAPRTTTTDKNMGLANPASKNPPRGTNINHQSIRHNTHPTVKSVKLMSWLITLVTKEGHIVLDPFAGSGTTGVAAKLLNRKYILMEKKQEYADIAQERLSGINVLTFEEKPKGNAN